jgi:hypothetical protein
MREAAQRRCERDRIGEADTFTQHEHGHAGDRVASVRTRRRMTKIIAAIERTSGRNSNSDPQAAVIVRAEPNALVRSATGYAREARSVFTSPPTTAKLSSCSRAAGSREGCLPTAGQPIDHRFADR